MIKYFRFDLDFVYWGISWANLLMLSASIPTYDDLKDKEDDKPAKEISGKELAGFLGM